MPTNTPPLKLSEVLEEEYVRIHNAARPEYPVGATENQRLAIMLKLIHSRKQSALCISGGGIRSATFALGVIQGLARCGVLDKFHYLSTVSGGGYIGGWLTAWMHRDGMNTVIAKLTATPDSPLTHEPLPIRRLRDYSNYINPKLGLLSADTWTLIATVLRNMLLNWFVLIPLLAAALMIPRAGVPVLRMEVSQTWQTVCLIAGCLALAWGIGYIGLHRPSLEAKRGDQNSFLKWCFLPLTLAAILLVTYWAWIDHKPEATTFVPFVILGVVINLIAFLGGAVFSPSKVGWRTVVEAILVIITGALSGVLIWYAATEIFPNPHQSETCLLLYVCFSAPLFLLALLLAETVFVGLCSYLTSDHDREWWSRSGAWLLIYIVVWSAASALLIFGPMFFLWLNSDPIFWVETLGSTFGLSGLFTSLIGSSSKTAPREGSAQEGKQKNGGGFLSGVVKALLLPVFVISLVLLIALGAELVLHRTIPDEWRDYQVRLIETPFGDVLTLLFALLAFGFVMGLFININKFSLHAMYRNRLIRAYLGASREERDPNLFTGFDDNDNIQMHELWPNRNEDGNPRPTQPFHVVNMALNLVAGKKLAWQQRKAESFTVSPLHAGCYCVGYRKTEYDDGKEKTYYGGREGISLGTSVAISGAAASPNMGYHSSAVITFLMTLFNARLGWWLGNTGKAGDRTFKYAGPVMAAKPMIDEALGLTDDCNKYIYLSDGGHFENLALYEMVLRRCHTIVVSDAGQDGDFKFGDLGGAIRKIRIDFGIPITFEKGVHIYSRKEKKKGYYCAIGNIEYSCVDGAGTDGTLIYIKPAFYGDEPRDVYQHAVGNEAFPHDPTADQWFDESQFESYRILGSYAISRMWGHPSPDDTAPPSLDGFLKKVRAYLEHPVEPKPAGQATILDEFIDKVREFLERPGDEQAGS